MSLGTILVIILIIILLGGFSGRFRGYGYGRGHSGMGLIGVILVHGIVSSLESSQIRRNHRRAEITRPFSVRLLGPIRRM